MFDELRRELGAERAEAVLIRAIYRRGEEIGRAIYGQFTPGDLAGLKAAFLDGIPDGGRMFQPEVLHSDTKSLDIKFHACPLREAWQSRACRTTRSPRFAASPPASTTAHLKALVSNFRLTLGSRATKGAAACIFGGTR